MNLPNKLTILRVMMVPLFLFFFFAIHIPFHMLWAFLIFALASLTDMLDGKIARKQGLVTDFGKLMDPLADKLLVVSAMVCILGSGYATGLEVFTSSVPILTAAPLIALIVVVSRDFIVTSIRLVAAGNGVVIAADKWGKLKTVFQMLWLCWVLLSEAIPATAPFFSGIGKIPEYILFYGMLILTVGSGFNYVWQNRQLFADA